MAVKYLDNAGTQYLVNKIKAIDGKIPTESQITTMITTALNTYKEGIVTIVESLPQTGEEGKLYLMVDPSDSDVYIIYTWEENAFKRMGSKTFTLTVDSALSSTSTNPVQNKVVKSALDGKANSSHTHGSITNDGKLGTASRVVITGTDKKIGISTVTTTQLGYLSGVTSAIQTQLDGKSATGHTHTAGDVAGLATVATTGSYNDLSDKPSINNATLTIQKNGSTVKTFTANASSNVTANITVPTKTSDLTNDSNFVDTSNSAVASGITSAKVTSYDAHIADTDIHVTTADKNKWNNQTYVFRYSSTALVASSTNSNALLDNTDNLKVGDKVIDSSGVLFSITAIDTVNSTFTVGSALIDLALDGNVVHTSGNETIAGDKVFNNRLIKNIDVVLGTAPSTGKSSNIEIADNNKYALLQMTGGVYDNGYSYARFYIQNKTADDGTGLSPTGTLRTCGFNISLPATSTSDGQGSITPRANKTTDFGLSGYQWRSVWCEKLFLNGTQLDPSAFVTTDTNQTIGGYKTFTNSITLQNSDTSGLSRDLSSKSQIAVLGDAERGDNTKYRFVDKNNNEICYIRQRKLTNSNTDMSFCVNNIDNDNNSISAEINFIIDRNNDPRISPSVTDSISLGRPTFRWKNIYSNKINGLEPSSLSLPSGNDSDKIDISSYITDLNGTPNSYTPPANGYLTFTFSNGSRVQIYTISGGGVSSNWVSGSSAGIIRGFIPVLKNSVLRIVINATTMDSFYFIPCQGNV